MNRRQSEEKTLTQLQRLKASYRSHIKRNYEHAAEDCRSCPTRGVCCTDAHFVNVNITRLEAVAIRETLARTPRLSAQQRQTIYERARAAIKRFSLSLAGDTFSKTYSCPLYEPLVGCLVHQRGKPAPCIQHACYDNWEDLPPTALQSRVEQRVERLNTEVYGAAWKWLPIPIWLALVDPASGGEALERLAREWGTQRIPSESVSTRYARDSAGSIRPRRASLPVIQSRT